MGIPTPQEITAAMVKWTPWVDLTNDYKETKVTATNLSSTISGMKGDITLMKVEMAGLFAASVGLFKIDYTLIKLDDKGLTINGRQRFGWPWADKAKSVQLKLERQQRSLVGDQKKLKRKLDGLSADERELAAAQRRLQAAEGRLLTAQRTNNPRQIARETILADGARSEVQRLEKRLENTRKKAEKLAASASITAQKVKDLTVAEDKAKNRWKNDAAETVGDLNRLRAALGQAAFQA